MKTLETYNTVVGGISLDDLELNSSHASTDQEEVPLADGSVGLQEVGFEVNLEQVSSDALNSVVDREDVNAFAVFDISAGVKGDNISETDTKVLTNNCGTKT